MSAVETPVCIVLAWTTIETQYVGQRAHWRSDPLGDRRLHPEDWQEVKMPYAMMWCNEGGPDDVEKARKCAVNLVAEVFVYEVGEPDPLGRAKREILEKKERS